MFDVVESDTRPNSTFAASSDAIALLITHRNFSLTSLQDYQVKEQCRNCTFLNGQFADECEMCGEPLSNHSQQHATKSYNRPGSRDNKYL